MNSANKIQRSLIRNAGIALFELPAQIRSFDSFAAWFTGQTRRNSYRPRHSRRAAFGNALERLEVRTLLTGNLTIQDIKLVDVHDVPLPDVSDLAAGADVFIHVDYQVSNIPAGATYTVAFGVNGFTETSVPFNAGVGMAGTTNQSAFWGIFAMTPGANQVSVTLNPSQALAETSYTDNHLTTTFNAALPPVGGLSYSVSQIRTAYGLNNIPDFGSAFADGTGQTIAIVDEFNDPTLLDDLDQFDKSMNISSSNNVTLSQIYGSPTSFVSVYNQSGVNITNLLSFSGELNVPNVDPNRGVAGKFDWGSEEAMDVEWAHAIAPGAHIDVVETTGSGDFGGLLAGASTAASLPGVSVVSMSWSLAESNWNDTNGAGERALDSSTFSTPNGHPGVTFLASTGDGGTPGGYPGASPNVIAVGGTSLFTNGYNYGSETGWSFAFPRTLINGDSSYSETGTWTSDNTAGFNGHIRSAEIGTTSTAQWTTSLNPSFGGWQGGYDVSATWVPSILNATNATYKIYDGDATTGRLLGTVKVDQTKAPVGTADGRSEFQELGDFFPTSGRVTVVLSSLNANGNVCADAVGVASNWASAGGQSVYETEPSYQSGVQSSGNRMTPDVSFDGSILTGVDAWYNGSPALGYFGTSLSAPCWAGIMAIVDQGRVAVGGSAFNSATNPTQALQAIYDLPATDFHDITVGYNGLPAGPGYDEVTGRGTPIANLLVPDLVASGSLSLSVTTEPAPKITVNTNFTVAVAAKYPNGTIDQGYTGPMHLFINTDPGNVPDGPILSGNLVVNAIQGVATFTANISFAGSGYSLAISADGFSNAITNSFIVTDVNHAPVGTSTTVLTKENQPYHIQAADFGFTDPNDNPANSLLGVKFTLLPGAGSLTDNGIAITANQLINATDFTAGKVVFMPPTNETGLYFVGKFEVEDDGGTVNGGVNIDPNPKIMDINIIHVNQAPVGTQGTVTVGENTPYTFMTSDFGFTDPNDHPANSLLGVKFTLLPSVGTLRDNLVPVTVNQIVSAADIVAGKLVFQPPTNLTGGPYFLSKFQVEDDGGTANGGVNLDPDSKLLYYRSVIVNHAPVGTSGTVTGIENTNYQFKAVDFGFTDPNDIPPNALTAVKFSLLPGDGTLKDNGVALAVNQLVSVTDINAGLLRFVPNANVTGLIFLGKFQVEDNGGTVNGGVNLDPTARILDINLLKVNQAPVGANGTVTVTVNTPYTLKTSDFGFTDPNDSPANTLLAVKFVLLPGGGTLSDNGVNLVTNQFVSAADIGTGKLKFTPNANLAGGPYFLCKFQVEDNGGTVNGGSNLDPNPKILYFKTTT